MGAGLTYAEMYQDEVALKVAAVNKLTRNLFLAAVIPGLAYLNASMSAEQGVAGWLAREGLPKVPMLHQNAANTRQLYNN
eukprot:scaffold141380_cov20-Prasinocladus_malaysianus.AAC.1